MDTSLTFCASTPQPSCQTFPPSANTQSTTSCPVEVTSAEEPRRTAPPPRSLAAHLRSAAPRAPSSAQKAYPPVPDREHPSSTTPSAYRTCTAAARRKSPLCPDAPARSGAVSTAVCAKETLLNVTPFTGAAAVPSSRSSSDGPASTTSSPLGSSPAAVRSSTRPPSAST